MSRTKIKIYIKFLNGDKVTITSYVESGDLDCEDYINSLVKFSLDKSDEYFSRDGIQAISFYITFASGVGRITKLCYKRD